MNTTPIVGPPVTSGPIAEIGRRLIRCVELRDGMVVHSDVQVNQAEKYRDFYRRKRWRWIFRFDVRYRCRRLAEVLASLQIETGSAGILDVGFGTGRLLKTFPVTCRLHGAEISESAVEGARNDSDFRRWSSAEFFLVGEDADDLPDGPYDIILSSHTIEHVPDDMLFLRAAWRRLTRAGILIVFAPIEEPEYIPQHVRNYPSLDALTNRIESAGFEALFSEGSMHINGHVWKVITIPSRRQWPLLKPVVDAFRSVTLSLIPYRLKRMLDSVLDRLGFGPRQGLVVARRPTGLLSGQSVRRPVQVGAVMQN